MEVLFLGTGTSTGIPIIACDCAVCRSTDPRNKRTRTSVHVVMGGLHIQVDAAPELREQCLRHDVRQVDIFLLTHAHSDHIVGMDDLRRFCDLRGSEGIPIYGSAESLQRVRDIFPYAIGARPVFKGYPAFTLHDMPAVLDLGVGKVSSTILPHGVVRVLGFVFEEYASGAKFSYYTDCKDVPEEALALARGSDVVVLDGLRPEPHPTHMSIPEALAVAARIGAGRTLLTHMTHSVDHATVDARMPPGAALAYDGLRLTLGRGANHPVGG